MKVWQVIGIVEADGWKLVRTRPEKRLTVTLREAGDEKRVTVTFGDSHHRHQHPSAGRLTVMTRDYSKLAEQYLILVAGGPPTNYSAWSPDLPGCAATGDTIEECVAQMKEAIAFHLEGLAEDGDPIPDPSGPGVYVARDPLAVA